jgi:tetratricopeptide (TPR) repeat protein
MREYCNNQRYKKSCRNALFITLLLLLFTGMCHAAYQQLETVGVTMNGAQFPIVANDGRIWVPVYSDNRLRIFDANGNRALFSPITSGLDASGNVKAIENPSGVAIYQNTVYLTCDSYSGEQYILKFSESDGSPIPGFSVNYTLGQIEADSQGRLFVVEKTGRNIHVLNQSGQEIAGSPISLPANYSTFRGLAVSPDDKTIYVTSEYPGVILRLTGGIDGGRASYGKAEVFISNLNKPTSVDIGKDGRIYVSEFGDNRIRIYTPDGKQQEQIQGGQPPLRFPQGVAFANNGNTLYIAEFTASKLQQWSTGQTQGSITQAQQPQEPTASTPTPVPQSVVNIAPLVPQSAPTVTSSQTVPTAVTGDVGYWVQVGAFTSDENVSTVSTKVMQLGYSHILVLQGPGPNNITLKKIRLGPYASVMDASKVKADLIQRLIFPGLVGNYWILSGKLTGGGESPTGPTLAYRVLVSKFTTSMEGAQLKATLESQGRYPVFNDHNPPTYDVTIGNYPSEQEAQGLLQSLKDSGYPDAQVVQAGEVAPTTPLTQEEQKSIESKQASVEQALSQQRYLEAIPQLEEILRANEDNTKIIKQLQETIAKLNDDERKRLEEENKKREEEQDRIKQAAVHNSNALSLWEQGNADAAIAEWNKVLQLDPNNATAQYFLRQATKKVEELPAPQKKIVEEKGNVTKELDTMFSNAQHLYLTQQYDEALKLFRQIIAKDPKSPQATDANEAIVRVQAEKDQADKKAKEEAHSAMIWNIIYIVGGIILLLVLAFGGYKLMGYLKSRPKTEKAPKPEKAEKQPAAPAPTKGSVARTGTLSQQIAAPEDHSKARELTPEQMEKKKQGDEWYKKGMAELEAKNWDEAISCFLTAASLDPNNPEPRGKVERVKFLRREEEKLAEAQKKAIAQADTQVVPPAPKEEQAPTISIARPPTAPAPAPKTPTPETTVASTAIAAATTVVGSAGFQQNFDDETVGSMPKGWVGEYAHASLEVEDAVTATNSGKGLKFEKQSGTASTHYRCKFNEMRGRITVEFDIRCDSKNKYFLGVYIESDEDFRKAVHTVIHTTEDGTSAALRLQGESVPYQLGTWAHIKYILNLTDSSVDAFVNNQNVVKGARIPGTPEMMNTLSIRDNPATTALLYLDNIQITAA